MIAAICALSIATIILLCLCIFFYKTREKENEEIVKKNIVQQREYDSYKKLIDEQQNYLNKLNNRIYELGTELKLLNQKKQDLNNDIVNSQEISRNAFSKYQEALDQAYQHAEKEYDKLKDKMDKDAAIQTELIQKQILEVKQELDHLKEMRAAAIEAQRREELLKQTKDDYRIVLNENELSTIKILNEIKPRLPEQRILCMLIWQSFYQKKMSTLCKKLLGNKTVCGIYKITNIKNDMCYIGQSKDVETRWTNHMKAGLGIDTPVGNKLYQAMKESGLENFTFELLKECSPIKLDEEEKYYISLYQSKDFGYNSTSGNK